MSASSAEREARRWLHYASNDLDAAIALSQQRAKFAAQICFLAQQAAEKSLKALLIREQIEFPLTHDLDRLRNALPDSYQTHQAHPDLAELTEWAVEARYPTQAEPATPEDAQRVLQQASAVWRSAHSDWHSPGAS